MAKDTLAQRGPSTDFSLESKRAKSRIVAFERPGISSAGAIAVSQQKDTTRLLSDLVRGGHTVSSKGLSADFLGELQTAADYHGVGPLIAHVLSNDPGNSGTASRLLGVFQSQGHAETALDLVRERELVRVLEALAQCSIHPLLIKGSPLAYTHYPSPALRVRGDTDILITEEQSDSTRQTLLELGYKSPNAVSGEWVSHQYTMEKQDGLGVDHVLDVHLKLSNHQIFAGLLSYDELARDSVSIPPLGKNARTLDPKHSLMLACTHRVGHFHSPYYVDDVPHYGGNRLIWLYDIHLLVTGMSPNELEAFAALVREKRVKAVCLDGLMRAREYFGTPLTDTVIEILRDTGDPEPSAAYLEPGGLRYFVTELRALPGWRARATLLKEHAFPSSEYMLHSYAVFNRAWLPALYLHRGLRGAWKRIRRP